MRKSGLRINYCYKTNGMLAPRRTNDFDNFISHNPPQPNSARQPPLANIHNYHSNQQDTRNDRNDFKLDKMDKVDNKHQDRLLQDKNERHQ